MKACYTSVDITETAIRAAYAVATAVCTPLRVDSDTTYLLTRRLQAPYCAIAADIIDRADSSELTDVHMFRLMQELIYYTLDRQATAAVRADFSNVFEQPDKVAHTTEECRAAIALTKVFAGCLAPEFTD